MHNAPARTVFDIITDFLAADPSSEAIIAYRLPEWLEKRAQDLLEWQRQRDLSFDEQLELYDFIRADDMMSLLKAKTYLKLTR